MIEITSITPPEVGWPIVCYCPLCKETTIILSLYAAKPEDGDYWKMNPMCLHDNMQHTHGMTFGLQKVGPPKLDMKEGWTW